jgi:hypothetical protein
VPFSNNGPLDGISHTAGTTTFTVSEAGTYLFAYSVTITSGIGAQIALAVNGVVDSSTSVELVESATEATGIATLTLSAGDVITLRNNSVTALTLVLAPSVGASLNGLLLTEQGPS